jgi:hypothetical protein
MGDIEELLKALVGAKKGDRDIDAQIALHIDGWKSKTIGGRTAWRKNANGRYDFNLSPIAYTASADAVLALLLRRLPDWNWRLEGGGEEPFLAVISKATDLYTHTHKTSPALTLLGAMLAVLIAEETEAVAA